MYHIDDKIFASLSHHAIYGNIGGGGGHIDLFYNPVEEDEETWETPN